MYLLSVGSGVSIMSVYVSGLVRSRLCVCEEGLSIPAIQDEVIRYEIIYT